MTNACISLILDPRTVLLSFHISFSLVSTAIVCTILIRFGSLVSDNLTQILEAGYSF